MGTGAGRANGTLGAEAELDSARVSLVMAGHRRSQNGVASLVYFPANHGFLAAMP